MSIAQWTGAVLVIIALIIVVGGAVAFAYEFGIEPVQLAGFLLLGVATLLVGATALRSVLLKSGLLKPRAKKVGKPDDAAPERRSRPAWPERDTMLRVKSELERGRQWRAKEILQGQIRTFEYTPQLYRLYGEVLLGMGDDLEAGRYLFLGAAESAPAKAAIELYLSRFDDPEQLFATFPSNAKLPSLKGYPAQVREVLEERHVRPKPTRRTIECYTEQPWPWLDAAWGGFLAMMIFLCFVAGFVTLSALVLEVLV